MRKANNVRGRALLAKRMEKTRRIAGHGADAPGHVCECVQSMKEGMGA